MKLLRVLIFSILFSPAILKAQEKNIKPASVCQYWQSKVDPTVKITAATSSFNEEQLTILPAIECLLKLKGKTYRSVYNSGTVGYHLSTRFPAPSVELAALYYVSYLFYQDWRHAGAIALFDKNGKMNSKRIIRQAYKAYAAWFEKIKKAGLDKSREQNINPLAGTDIFWQP